MATAVFVPPAQFPARTPVFQEDGAPKTLTTPWFLFFQAALTSGFISYGLADNKPATAQDGSLYVETDRGNVLYQYQEGNWQFIGGAWVAPIADQPADLGTYDSGFLFLASDTKHYYSWTGSGWLDITPTGGSGPGTNLYLAVSVTAPMTITSPGTPTDGQMLTVRVTQDSTGHAVSFDNTAFVYAPNLDSTANLVSVVIFVGMGGLWTHEALSRHA